MKRSAPLILGLALIAITASPALAQRRSGNVNTPYGQFNASEMAQAGGNPMMALEIREQKQMMQYQQQMLKEQQQLMKEEAKRQEYLKKHPELAKPQTLSPRPAKKATKTPKKTKPATDPAASNAEKAGAASTSGSTASKIKKAG